MTRKPTDHPKGGRSAPNVSANHAADERFVPAPASEAPSSEPGPRSGPPARAGTASEGPRPVGSAPALDPKEMKGRLMADTDTQPDPPVPQDAEGRPGGTVHVCDRFPVLDICELAHREVTGKALCLSDEDLRADAIHQHL